MLIGDRERLAAALLSLADSVRMLDDSWQSDSRVQLARTTLDIPTDGRYSHKHVWQNIADGMSDDVKTGPLPCEPHPSEGKSLSFVATNVVGPLCMGGLPPVTPHRKE